MQLILGLGAIIFFLLLGLVVGGMNERNHFRQLGMREAQTSDILVTQLKSFPACSPVDRVPTMLVAEVVISSDYLKSFLAGIRNIFGGEVRSFQTMLERARREALQRIREEAREMGYNAICNVRLETADMAGRTSSSKNKIVMAAILVSATGYNAAVPGSPD